MASFEETVSRNLQCPVCSDLLNDPKQLSCMHTFCQKCLGNQLACSSKTKANSLLCLICQSKTDVKGGGVKNLNTNIPVKSHVDDIINCRQICEMCDTQSRAGHFCRDCGKNVCNACLERHNNLPLNLKHRVTSVDDIREGKVVLKKKVYCQEHVPESDEEKCVCTHVCTTCKKLICRRCMNYHVKKGHIVQDAEEYNASIKAEIESLLNWGKTKLKIIKNHITFVETQIECVTDHNDGEKEKMNYEYEESTNKSNERRAVSKQQSEAEKGEICQRLKEMKDADERWVARIESAITLASDSLKAPLEGDIVAISDSMRGELKNVLDRDDPQKKLASHVADRAEQLTFTLNNQYRKLSIGRGVLIMSFLSVFIVVLAVSFSSFSSQDRLEYNLKYGVEFPKGGNMSVMIPTPDGRMAVGYWSEGIDIYSADGQLQRTLLRDIGIRGLGFLSDGRYVVLDNLNNITLYPPEYKKNEVRFDTLSIDESGRISLTVDNDDQIYVGYRKAMEIHVFLPAGGKPIRKIPCNRYVPTQIKSYGDLLIVRQDDDTVIIIDKTGFVKHNTSKPSGNYLYTGVTRNDSVLIASVRHEEGLMSIEEYTNELTHTATLISDHKFKKSDKDWYYLQEFPSGEIAFCTPDRLYIFNLSIASMAGQVDSPVVWFVNQGIRYVELPKKNSMTAMAATLDGMMAVGSMFGELNIFSADGQLQRTINNTVRIREVGFLSDGRYVVLNTNNSTILYTSEWEQLDVGFETLSFDEGGISMLSVDGNDQIYVGYRKAKMIQVFSTAGGKAIREIRCKGYEPIQITTLGDSLVVQPYRGAIGIIDNMDKEGRIEYKESNDSGETLYAGVTNGDSVLIAFVRHEKGLVRINEYTRKLKRLKTLISDYKIEKPDRDWYYLQQFQSGEIAFCTPDRFYIFQMPKCSS